MGYQLVAASLPKLIDALQFLRTSLELPGATLHGETRAAFPISPYKLLHYYDVADAHFFFGRESEIERLVSMISAYPLVVVTGASGPERHRC